MQKPLHFCGGFDLNSLAAVALFDVLHDVPTFLQLPLVVVGAVRSVAVYGRADQLVEGVERLTPGVVLI